MYARPASAPVLKSIFSKTRALSTNVFKAEAIGLAAVKVAGFYNMHAMAANDLPFFYHPPDMRIASIGRAVLSARWQCHNG